MTDDMRRSHATVAEVAALKSERDAAVAEAKRLSAVIANKEAAIGAVLDDAATLRAENERLRQALEPFAAVAQETWETAPDGSYLEDIGMGAAITLGICRIARAALRDTP